MHWNETVQEIIDYVERCLQDEEVIDQAVIVSLAGCSYAFFQKVFAYMNDFSFAEYVRNRKLTLAGIALKGGCAKVINVSFQFGYESPTSFAKAFQLFHGISPSLARKQDGALRVFPKLQMEPVATYEWNLSQKAAIQFVGKRFVLEKNQDPFAQIPKIWSLIQMDGTFLKLLEIDEGTPKGLFSFYDLGTYTIMVISKQEPTVDLISFMSPMATWAVFQCHGQMPQGIQNGLKYLHQEWFIKYPFRHAPMPTLEWYSEGNVFDEAYLSQIWVPILEDDKNE